MSYPAEAMNDGPVRVLAALLRSPLSLRERAGVRAAGRITTARPLPA
jgi:hypothetical protein